MAGDVKKMLEGQTLFFGRGEQGLIEAGGNFFIFCKEEFNDLV